MVDPLRNPYTPGAGRQPAELAGRDEVEQRFRTTLSQLERGRGAPCVLVVGLRGVGKTVLLKRFAEIARADNWLVYQHELRRAKVQGTFRSVVNRRIMSCLSRNRRASLAASAAAGPARPVLSVTPLAAAPR